MSQRQRVMYKSINPTTFSFGMEVFITLILFFGNLAGMWSLAWYWVLCPLWIGPAIIIGFLVLGLGIALSIVVGYFLFLMVSAGYAKLVSVLERMNG